MDYPIVALYFLFVLSIGWAARAKVSSSIDFFLSGHPLPAWVTGLAFILVNLGVVEIVGMSANGVQYGFRIMYYFWIGAIPVMVFLGIVMMPFYYGSKVRSVPEFMLHRFGPGTHLVNASSFAIAQLLIAGINLLLLAKVANSLLDWPLRVTLIVAAVIVLSYITPGGLSAAIYNEVLQFFVIVASLLPLTLIGLHSAGGWNGLKASAAVSHMHAWPGTDISGLDNPVISVIGLVFGLGFVLSFDYWTTNFTEVQRSMAVDSPSSARKIPIIGTFPKMFVPFIVVVPGMIAGATVTLIMNETVKSSDAILYFMRDLLPNDLLGIVIAGLLAAFVAGMVTNISAFNTMFNYDIWQTYVIKNRDDDYYFTVGCVATVGATIIAVFTAPVADNFGNMMDYLQTLFGLSNVPLFAIFLIGMSWERTTPVANWSSLIAGTDSAILYWYICEFTLANATIFDLPGQDTAFVAASIAFIVDVFVAVVVSLFTTPKSDEELVGFAKSVTPKANLANAVEAKLPLLQRTVPLDMLCLALVIVLNVVFA